MLIFLKLEQRKIDIENRGDTEAIQRLLKDNNHAKDVQLYVHIISFTHLFSFELIFTNFYQYRTTENNTDAIHSSLQLPFKQNKEYIFQHFAYKALRVIF